MPQTARQTFSDLIAGVAIRDRMTTLYVVRQVSLPSPQVLRLHTWLLVIVLSF